MNTDITIHLHNDDYFAVKESPIPVDGMGCYLDVRIKDMPLPMVRVFMDGKHLDQLRSRVMNFRTKNEEQTEERYYRKEHESNK